MVTLFNKVQDSLAADICRQHDNKPEELLEILHTVQRERGFLSEDALRTIAYMLNLSRAEVHGVASFYHDFKREAQAKTVIKICRAEACQANDCDDLIEKAENAFETKLDAKAKDVALESIFCLGNCALGPAVMIEDDLYGRVDIDRLKSIVESRK